MARKEINIGSTGNDATGDSIRTGFDKVNKNFVELYAALGLGGGLNFQNLDNTPSTITSDKVLATNNAGNALVEKELVGDGITIDNATDPTKIYIRNSGTELVRDTSPQLGGNLDAQNFFIENLATPTKTGDATTKQYVDDKFLDAAGDTATGQILLQDGSGDPQVPTLRDQAVNKEYADSKVAVAGDSMTGPLILSTSPAFGDPALQAATKGYVDNNSFTSENNIFVSVKGRTEEEMLAAGVDQSQIGRSNSAAFNSVRDALFYCERIVKGDIELKKQGLLPASHEVYWRVPGTKPGPYTATLAADGTEDTTNVLANSLLTKNRKFVQEEVLAYIENEIADGDNTDDFADTFTFDRDYCYRDIGLLIDAISFDLTYVGNSKTVDAAASYWDGATSRVAGQRSETIAAINFAKTLIQNYVLTNTAYVAPANTENPYAYDLITQNIDYVADETIAYIDAQITAGTGIWSGFTYDAVKCRRDTVTILQGLAFDLKYGGNTQSRENASRYWDGATSRVAGQQAQTIDALEFTRDLVTDYILLNTDWTSRQVATTQTKTANDGEAASRVKVDTLMGNITTVINSGLGSLPAYVGTYSNQSGETQYIDTALVAESGASTTIGSLIDIITDVIDNGLGSLPTKTGGQGRETNIPIPEITVFIESGVYEEYMPMVVPDNVSIKGDELRRVIITPIVGVRPPQRSLDLTYEKGNLKRYDGTTLPKESRFRNHYDSQYSRADTYSGAVNQTGDTEIAVKDLAYELLHGTYFTYNGTTYYVKGFVYDPSSVGDRSRASATLYSDINLTTATTLQDTIPNSTVIEFKKLNQHMDVFLMNNATIMRNLSIRRHQGFVNVLDPEGQILTKSPYCQTCSSFSAQGGGGQYVDGNSGVQYGTVVDNPASGFSITLQGLTRRIQLPTTFLYQDSRNFVAGVSDFEKGTYRVIGATAPVDDGLGAGTFKQTLTLAADTEIKSYTRSNLAGDIPQGTEIRVETAGNKSMTCNDYTQLNDSGYGLVATNAGLIEAVSVFTYYCDTSYLAANGGQIRSLNGSSCYGTYGIKAEGSDPNENIQSGLTFFRHVNATATGSPDVDYSQVVKAYTPTGSDNLTGNDQILITDFDYMPFEDSRIELTAYSTNNDTTEYVVEEVIPVSVNITGVTVGSPCKITTSGDHLFRHGSVVELSGIDGAGFLAGVDGAYYINTTAGGLASNEFYLYTDSGLSTAFDSTAFNDGGYTSGATAKWGGRATLNLNTELSLGAGVQIPNDADILITVGKKILIENLIDAPRVLPSSALQFLSVGIDDQVFRILNVERIAVLEPSGSVDVQEHLLNLRVPPNLTGGVTCAVTTKISTMRATGHDFLNVGWGNYADSNYPNNVFGAPEGRPDYSAAQSNEAVEVGSGRVFYASTDQDGNFRVGEYFRVNQGDGSVELNANIGLTNVDSLKFTKGTSIDEFSTDSKMQGQSDDAVPTEATIVEYINSAIIGQHTDGNLFPEPSTTGSQTGGTYGLLNRAGYNGTNLSWNKMNGELNMNSKQITNVAQGTSNSHAINKLYADNVFKGGITDSVRTDVEAFTMLNDSTLDSGAIDMNGNRIKSLRDPEDGTDAVNKQYVDAQNKLDSLEGITISGSPSNTDILMFTGNNSADYLGNPIHGAVNVALDTTTNSTSGSRVFGEPSGTGSDVRLTRAGNTLQIALASGSVKNTDVSAEADIAQSKLAMTLAPTRASANAGGKLISTVTLNNPIRIVTTTSHNLVNGDPVTINDVLGTTELNGNTYYASYVNGTTIDLYSDSGLTTTVNGTTGFTAYVSGGTIINSRLLQASSGLASFDSDEFTLTNGWVTHRISSSVSTGLPLTKLQYQAGNSILGVSGASAAAVTALTAGQIRTIINVENGADVTDYDNVKTAGAIMKDGTVSMNDSTTLKVYNIEPKGDNVTDSGSSSKYWNDTYTTTVNGRYFKAKDTNGIEIQNNAGTAALTINNTVANSTFAGSSAKLTTARTISLSGEASGSVSFDGSGNADIAVTLSNSALDDQYVNIGGDTLTGTLITQAVRPSANNTYDLGTSGNKWANVYATLFQGTATSARFADLAENYASDNAYEEGTVLMFGGDAEVTVSTKHGTTKVAGVVSTNPAHLMNAELEAEHVVALALQGRVPCKVVGKIEKGDMIVASDLVGVATASDDPKMGSVIGKALQDYDSDKVGVIEVVVGRL